MYQCFELSVFLYGFFMPCYLKIKVIVNNIYLFQADYNKRRSFSSDYGFYTFWYWWIINTIFYVFLSKLKEHPYIKCNFMYGCSFVIVIFSNYKQWNAMVAIILSKITCSIILKSNQSLDLDVRLNTIYVTKDIIKKNLKSLFLSFFID